jgi:phospholipid transport system substrate-binding protein
MSRKRNDSHHRKKEAFIMTIRIAGLTLVIFLILPGCLQAGVPLSVLEGRINEVLDILRDPALQNESAEEVKKEKIRSISGNMFDFYELARRTLGKNWKKLTNNQKKEFIGLYRHILENAYMNKIMSYTDEKVVFVKENMLSEKKAEVATTIITKSAEIPIHYRLINKNEQWLVYDVIIEGVSLVKNYRSQFRSILAKKSVEELLDMLRD